MLDKLREYLPSELADRLLSVNGIQEALEIRLRVSQKLQIRFPKKICDLEIYVTPSHIKQVMEIISGYSLYTCCDDISRGFITTNSGWRVGIGGQFKSGMDIRGMKTVSSLNIRVPRQVMGCADVILPYIKNGTDICNTLIISPPMCGKTTLMRDIVRQLSNSGIFISLIDERCELANVDTNGIPSMDIGRCTDVIGGCSKAEGVMMALRSLAPQLIALDEIGDSNDIPAIYGSITGGVGLLCTIHGNGIEQIRKKKYISELLKDKLFSRYIVLEGKGRVRNIFNEDMVDLWCG